MWPSQNIWTLTEETVYIIECGRTKTHYCTQNFVLLRQNGLRRRVWYICKMIRAGSNLMYCTLTIINPSLYIFYTTVHIVERLKSLFCKKSLFFRMQLWPVEHFLTNFVITFGWVCCCFSVAPTWQNDKKWPRNVQMMRGSFGKEIRL